MTVKLMTTGKVQSYISLLQVCWRVLMANISIFPRIYHASGKIRSNNRLSCKLPVHYRLSGIAINVCIWRVVCTRLGTSLRFSVLLRSVLAGRLAELYQSLHHEILLVHAAFNNFACRNASPALRALKSSRDICLNLSVQLFIYGLVAVSHQFQVVWYEAASNSQQSLVGL